MEPPLAPLHFGEEKMRKKERKKRGKKKSAPPLRISGFATDQDNEYRRSELKEK